MFGLTVLSPHCDDAVFDLYLCLSKWARVFSPLNVVTFFSISEYAPHVPRASRSDISVRRRREDRRALRTISTVACLRYLNLLDAPLRLNIAAAEICSRETAALLTSEDIQRLGISVRRYCGFGGVLCPLGLGGHVDHLAVKYAASNEIKPGRLAFYEDLPYSLWTSESELIECVANTQERARVKLRPAFIRATKSRRWAKFQAARIYQSQVDSSEAKAIADFSARYGGAERIWIPTQSAFWRQAASDE